MDREIADTLERELERLGADELNAWAAEQQQVLLWRAVQFSELGFDGTTAVALAQGPVDLNDTRKLVATGCPLELASRILL